MGVRKRPLESVVSAAERRALYNNEQHTMVRIGDLFAVVPAITGKIELVYEGEQEGPEKVAQHLIGLSLRKTFKDFFLDPSPKRRSGAVADPYAEVVRYSEIISERVTAKNNIPQFDLMMLGLGEDGHTASIFPGSEHLFSSDKLCEVAINPYSMQKRITVTGKIINHSRTVLFLITGDSKAEMVARIIDRKEGWDKLPASMVNPSQGELIWLLDEKAASELSNVVDFE